MSTLIIKPADRQSIDFAETERVKSASSGAVVHSTDLNNYAKKDLSNVTYPQNLANGTVTTGAGDRVIETYISSDGLTWYRKWASGWKECGGYKSLSTSGNATYTVTLPITFTNVNSMTPTANCANWYDSSYACQLAITTKTTSSIGVRISGSDITKIYWTCRGF